MNMRDLRKQSGKKVEEIALALGVGSSTVRFWEQGRHEPRLPISQVQSLLDIYDCSLEDIAQATKESQKLFSAKT